MIVDQSVSLKYIVDNLVCVLYGQSGSRHLALFQQEEYNQPIPTDENIEQDPSYIVQMEEEF